MSAEVSLYLSQPGAQNHGGRCVGRVVVRGVTFTGQTHEGQRCLDLEVESLPPQQHLTVNRGDRLVALTLQWLQLTVELRTNQIPQQRVGRVWVDDPGMLPIGSSPSGPARWLWEILPEDVQRVEAARVMQPAAPLYFRVDITGIAKMMDPNGDIADVVPIRGSMSQLIIELSQWEQFLRSLEYSLPPSHPALAGLPSLDHPSWRESDGRLQNARSHHRSGEDYDALRECLSALEAVVHAPYKADSWKQRLTGLPEQKVEGLADLFSGVATYCNRIGHHRDRNDRDAAGDFPPMPLDHWEADLVLGAVQFVLTYVIRLRMAGLLVDSSPDAPPVAVDEKPTVSSEFPIPPAPESVAPATS